MSRIRGATESKVDHAGGAGWVRTGQVQGPSFGQELRTARLALVRSRLDDLLREIDLLGDRLVRERSLENLKAYREAIRHFLGAVQREALEVQSELDWDYRTWEQRRLTVTRKLDEELDALARMVLDNQQDRLQILAKVGEIKGLLLDLRL